MTAAKTKRLIFVYATFIINIVAVAQAFDTSRYKISIDTSAAITLHEFFTSDKIWRGGDGASSIDLGNKKTLWLFGDSFISDSASSRKKSVIVRNSIAIQHNHDLKSKPVLFYWKHAGNKPSAFFDTKQKNWYWPGHGIMIKDRLLIFMMKVREVTGGLGFETEGWDAALVRNPTDDPSKWTIKSISGGHDFGVVIGSAAVLSDDNYLYAYGVKEPGSHDVYLARWNLTDAYEGKLASPQWWLGHTWGFIDDKERVPALLFNGATEFSVHYDASLKKFIQLQSFGFGDASLGVRMADRPEGPWSDSLIIYKPSYGNIERPFMYSAKAHPEQQGEGFLVTYNINSFDFDELLNNQSIYFPRFIRVKITDTKALQ